MALIVSQEKAKRAKEALITAICDLLSEDPQTLQPQLLRDKISEHSVENTVYDTDYYLW